MARCDDGGVRGRYLAVAAAAWTAAFAGLYMIVVWAQGNSPVWWVVAALVAAIAMLLLAAADLWAMPMLIAAAVLLGGLAIAGSPSIGLLLAPAAAAAVLAVIRLADRPRSGTPTG
jgi:hypothetical protein